VRDISLGQPVDALRMMRLVETIEAQVLAGLKAKILEMSE
jgi:hypothetical protein